MSSQNKTLRRSIRIQARAKDTPVKGYLNASSDNEEESIALYQTNEDMRKELEHIAEDIQKPVELFATDDISGERIYGFETPHKKDDMLRKANQYRTPTATRKMKATLDVMVVLEKCDVNHMKNSLQNSNKPHKKVNLLTRKHSSELESSESESVSEPSEYVPSEVETEEELSESQDSDASNAQIHEGTTHSPKKQIMQHKHKGQKLHTSKEVDKQKLVKVYTDYHMKPDEYFETQSEKVITSNHTLERLKNSRLTKEKLEELLTNQASVSTSHKQQICTLTENYTSFFPMWQFILKEGYTVLLYGLGSKRCLINNFHKTIASEHPTLIVNGFFPSLAIKDVLDGILVDLLGLNCPANISDCLDLIEKVMKSNPKDSLYLLIHNIDGVMLRSNKAQDILSSLAAIPNIYVVASIDHINTPLLWDHVKCSKFNFYWCDVTTFLPYQDETSYESSLMVQQSGALALSSLHNVFLSLTSNAKSIYILLAEHQLSNSSNPNFAGMAFKDLYRAAREGFLVSSDLALRAQLTEFIDHKLVKTKRNIDGVEHLVIPLSNGLLKQFLDEHES